MKPHIPSVSDVAECSAEIGLLEIEQEPGMADGVPVGPQARVGFAAEAEDLVEIVLIVG